MRAIRFHEWGGPEVLRYEVVSEPQPDDTQVLIKVAAAGVNYSDLGRRQGSYAIPQPLPTVPGLEVAGTVSTLERKSPTLSLANGSWLGLVEADMPNMPKLQLRPCMLFLTHWALRRRRECQWFS